MKKKMGRPPKNNAAGIIRTRMNAATMAELAKGKMFEIERNPPRPFRTDQLMMKGVLEKFERTLKEMNVGNAVVVPKSTKNSLSRFVKEMHPNIRLKYTIIPDNLEMIRIYRVQ